MLNRLITKNAFFIRGSRDLFKKSSASPAPGPASTESFPFKFGGVDNYSSNELAIEAFGSERRQQFIALYSKLLDSIVNKDRAWLNERVEPKLIEPLLSIDNLKQINRQSSFELMYFNIGLGIGVTLEERDQEYKTMVSKNHVVMYSGDNSQNPASMMKYMTLGLPVLLSYQLGVRSSRKLISGESEKKGEEVHLLTLEQQTNVELKNMMKLMAEMNQQSMSKFRQMILGSNALWKVGNIDNFLKERY